MLEPLLPTVLAAGFADGINPCAFAVMAFLVAFLFALRKSRSHVLAVGAAYILGMYVVYFALGLGLLRGITLFGQPHLIAFVSAGVVVALGLVQVKDALYPRLPVHLSMPAPLWRMTKGMMSRTGVLSAAALGGLVGLCTVPCSGGIYVGILGLLASQASYLKGVGYLAVYNVMFVLPLVAILAVTGNRPTALALAQWERKHTRMAHLFAGVAMLALGAFILVWTL
ncbi:MAG: cytochrome c biogenesis protein CcdA [Chloroflexota bacterium]|nr:cytochrome c biogenesis protein CcdA [Chloroflexota bacterium]